MHNLVKIGKIFLWFFIILILFDAVWIGYTYMSCSRAMDDTLENIALVVAEDNCIDDSKADSIKELMVKNAPMWLTYNDDGMNAESADNPRLSRKPTNVIHTSLERAKNNVAWSASDTGSFLALKLSKSSDASHRNDYSLYDYTTCPNRGESITITLSANVNVYLLSMFPQFRQQSIPISKQITVVGMKFYKGKGGG